MRIQWATIWIAQPIVYCYFLFAFHPCKFCKIAPINLSWYFYKKCKCTVLNGDVTKWRIIMSCGYYFESLHNIAIKVHGRVSRHRKYPESYHTQAAPFPTKVWAHSYTIIKCPRGFVIVWTGSLNHSLTASKLLTGNIHRV